MKRVYEMSVYYNRHHCVLAQPVLHRGRRNMSHTPRSFGEAVMGPYFIFFEVNMKYCIGHGNFGSYIVHRCSNFDVMFAQYFAEQRY